MLVVGGAGSLFVDEDKTTRLMDTPEFPKEYLPTASNQGENLKDLQKTDSISWTFLSPAAFFDPAGKRTGSYQKGKDNVIVNEKATAISAMQITLLPYWMSLNNLHTKMNASQW